MIDPEAVANIRGQLKRAWRPFFSRFGRLTAVQLQAIPLILRKRNIVIAAPTASGKTEAVVAPLGELILAERWEGLSVLYVVPTRALANDLLARIEGPLSDMNVNTALKHGDRPELSVREPPNCLITTPESLDSLLCRFPHLLCDVRTAVLDEIHLLDNTYRGDQLRLLLRRLTQLSRRPPLQACLLSATLGSPDMISRRYASACEAVVVPGTRDIELHTVASLQGLHDLARAQTWRKILVFCNLRETVEATTATLSDLWRPYPVVPHHGSLSARLRAEAEEIMRYSDVAVCVSTSTLEVGIDIGDIDAVVLAEVPFSIHALLQRIGRGNRRQNRTNVVGLIRSEDEQEGLSAMIEAARAGVLPEGEYHADVSVAVQQMLSFLYQHREGAPQQTLIELIEPLCAQQDGELILCQLRESELLELRGSRFVLTEQGMDMGERGAIHSNIPDSQSYRVIEIETHREIGTLTWPVDEIFVLGGRKWRVISISGGVVYVRRSTERLAASSFRRHRRVGAFYPLLPEVLRR